MGGVHVRSKVVLRLDNKSRMSREVHVRFREGLGVKFPRATRLAIGFRDQRDAQRVMEVIPKRFGKYGITVHPRRKWFRSDHGRQRPRIAMGPMIVLVRSTFLDSLIIGLSP